MHLGTIRDSFTICSQELLIGSLSVHLPSNRTDTYVAVVMDSILTPRIFPLPPSAFMTPPDSDEKRVIHHVYQTPRPLPHLSVLLSPDDTPPRYLNKASELVDVLTELIDRGIKHTADYILSFLSPSDLVG